MNRHLVALVIAAAGCGAATANTAVVAAPAPTATSDSCVVGPRVISTPNVNGRRPVIASRRDEFAVAWVEAGEDHAELRLQIFDAHGEPLTQSKVVSRLSGGGGEPYLAATDAGYAMVWHEDRMDATAIIVQQFNTRGHPTGAAVESFTSPTARPLALTAARDGFVIVWWQWAKEPHLQAATWLDASGRRTSDVELTRMPCEDPTSDVRLQPDGRVLATWEQEIDARQHVIVGLLSKTGLTRQGSEYVGRDPALLREGVVMTGLDSASVIYAPFGAPGGTPIAPGRMVDGAVLGNDSVLCRAQAGSDESTTYDELSCAREQSGHLLRERRLVHSPRLLGKARVADTSLGYVVAVEGTQSANDEVDAVHLTVVQCND